MASAPPVNKQRIPMNGNGPADGVSWRMPSNIPIPDPSEITSREISRAKTDLREEFKLALENLSLNHTQTHALTREVLETRLDAMDKATVLLSDGVRAMPTSLDRESSRLDHLFNEKLKVVETEFQGMKKLAEAMQKAADTAVNAAFSAADRAVSAQYENFSSAIMKSETGFTKEIDSLKAVINNTKDGLNSQIHNLTSRIDRGEGIVNGSRQSAGDSRAQTTNIVGVIGGVVGVISLVAALAFGAASIGNKSGLVGNELSAGNSTKLDLLLQRNGAIPTPPSWPK